MRMPDQEVHSTGAAKAPLTDKAAQLLDNPIWHSLRTEHAAIALGDQRARRYPSHIGPLGGIPSQNEENYAGLAVLASGDIVVLFSPEPHRVPEGWSMLRKMDAVQMIREGAPGFETERGETKRLVPEMRPLTSADAPAMVALAELTEPGPFRLRTLELGGFYGIFEGDRLVAMAGRRLHLPGLIEVSGVCTHPDARGRGYARSLMKQVVGEIESEGKTAFLHAMKDNPAVHLYQRLGFRLRQRFHCAVLRSSF